MYCKCDKVLTFLISYNVCVPHTGKIGDYWKIYRDCNVCLWDLKSQLISSSTCPAEHVKQQKQYELQLCQGSKL